MEDGLGASEKGTRDSFNDAFLHVFTEAMMLREHLLWAKAWERAGLGIENGVSPTERRGSWGGEMAEVAQRQSSKGTRAEARNPEGRTEERN